MKSFVGSFFSYVFCFGLATLAAGCRKSDSEGSTGVADVQALMNSGYAWPGGRVEVCFLNEPSDPMAKDVLKRALDSNFTKSTTGVHFVGFTPCTPQSKAPAKLMFNVPRAYSRYVGTVGGFGPQGESITLPQFDRNSPSYFYNTAVHEFGHFAGLFHEQQRMENESYSLCQRAKDEIVFMNEFARYYPGIRAYGPFDRMSVMNYCVQGYFTQFLKLSAGDVNALRALYSAVVANSPGSTSAPVSSPSNPAEICNIVKVLTGQQRSQLPPGRTVTHTPDGQAALAWNDDSFRDDQLAGSIPAGTELSRLLTKPIYKAIEAPDAENLTAIQVIPKSGLLKDKKVWIYGNVTFATGCRQN